jgi:hypothetical protein
MISFLRSLQQPHPNNTCPGTAEAARCQGKPGAALEGCLYAKNSQQKTAPSMQHPDRSLFLLLISIFLCLTP